MTLWLYEVPSAKIGSQSMSLSCSEKRYVADLSEFEGIA
jgi:hypothetical protein